MFYFKMTDVDKSR